MSEDNALEITWFGQAMFAITGGGKTIVCDPTSPQTGYKYEPVEADLVLMSHDHFDHNYLSGVRGNPSVVKTPGSHSFENITIEGFPTFHDPSGGRERGSNIVFRWEQAGFRIAHLGDLGEYPDRNLTAELSNLDLVMIPVGGVFTIDAEQASRLTSEIKPLVLIPMHYGTRSCSIPLEKLDEFLNRVSFPVRRLSERPLRIGRESLPSSTEVWVLAYQ